MSHKPSVLIIGLDGAGFALLDPWFEAGELPALAGLVRRGSRSVLRSTPQPVSAPAWTTVLTGKNPGKHGVFGFGRPRRSDYRPEVVNSTHCRAQTLWQVVNRHGLRAGAIGVPMTYPPQVIDGFLIAGFDAPTKGQPVASPTEVLALFRQEVGEDYVHTLPPMGPDQAVPWDAVERPTRHTTLAAKLLSERYSPDVLMAVYSAGDHIQHAYWQRRKARHAEGGESQDVLLDTYRMLDAQVGELLAEVCGLDTQVIVMSDHGAGPTTRQLNIDNWLAAEGFLVRRGSDGAGMTVKHRAAFLARRAARKILGGKLSDTLSGRFEEQRKELARDMAVAGVDFSQTQVFATDSFGSLRLNIVGREALGALEAPDRGAVEAKITRALLGIRDPETGEQVISQVVKGPDLYHGPYTDEGPDLIAVPTGYRYVLRTNMVHSIAGLGALENSQIWEPAPYGEHNPEGILIVAGNAVKSGGATDVANLQDIAPTVLHLLGLPVPEDMDGHPLTDLLAGGEEVQHEAAPEDAAPEHELAAYTDEEQAEVEERLRNLGYM